MSLENDITKIQEDMFKPASKEDLKKREASVKYFVVGNNGKIFAGPFLTFAEADRKMFGLAELKDIDPRDLWIKKEYGNNESKIVNEVDEEDLFVPATGEEIEQRQGEYAHQEYVRKQARQAATRKRYAELPFTYEEIVHLRPYQQIMGLRDVTDITTDIQKQHKTTAFRMKYRESGRNAKKDYLVFANGYVRATSYSGGYGGGVDQSVIQKFDPSENIEDYAEVMEYLFDVMQRKWNKEHQSEIKKAEQAKEMEKKEIALEILRMINYPIEDHWKYDSNLNYSEIKAIYDRLRG